MNHLAFLKSAMRRVAGQKPDAPARPNGRCPTIPSLPEPQVERALSRHDAIPVEVKVGSSPDGIDRLNLYRDALAMNLAEMQKRIRADAETDPVAALLARTHHLPPAEKMQSASARTATAALAELMTRFGLNRESAIADVGCGIGWIAFNLEQLGFQNIVAMDPSDQSTAHLKDVAGDRIEIINDLDLWRSIRGRFDALVSMATVHHWEHIPWIALETRRTMKPAAYWFAVMEWFANTPKEFLQGMTAHPTRERYKCYEWAYPASAYVDLIESVGFKLVAAVPLYYRRNVFRYPSGEPPTPDIIDQDALDGLVDKHLTGPNGTVELFWAEVDERRRAPGIRLFTHPQVLVFQREGAD